MTNTTQGKWLIRTGTDESGSSFTFVELNDDGDSIADVYGGSMKETLSNANLIALAGNLNQLPEGASLLRDAVNFLDNRKEALNDGKSPLELLREFIYPSKT